MRPVSAEFPVNQKFGSYATGGVNPNQYGTEVQQLVYLYGNYQPYGHAGCDIACPIGTPVHAIADGTVLWADWGTNLPGDESDAGYRQRWYLYKTFPGIVTVIQHDGWISVYAHLSDAPLNAGDRVTEGQEIARSGNTRSPGVSLGAHLHVEALVDMSYSTGSGLIYGRTDPEPYFGGIAAMGSTITPVQEDDMPTLDEIAALLDSRVDELTKRTDAQHVESRAQNVAQHVKTRADTITGTQAQHDVTRGYLLDGVPASVLNRKFQLPDGSVKNLAGILTDLRAQPVAAAGGSVADPQAVANAVVSTLSKQLGK